MSSEGRETEPDAQRVQVCVALLKQQQFAPTERRDPDFPAVDYPSLLLTIPYPQTWIFSTHWEDDVVPS